MRKILPFLIAFSTLLGACRKTSIQKPEFNADGRDVELRFSTTDITTRSGDASESEINTVDILVFDGANQTFKYRRYAWQRYGSLYGATLKIGTNQDLYFAVNARSIIDNASLTEGMSWSEAQKALVMENPQSFNLSATNNGLPMWGYVLNQTINDAPSNSSSNYLGVIKLLRSVAAVELTVSDATFTLKEGSIVYGADKGLLAFAPANASTPDIQGNFRTNALEIPAGMTVSKTWKRTPPTGSNQLKHVFYMYENDNLSKHTKIILEGECGGSSKGATFYPLSLRNPNTNNKLPVKRNTKFIIVVTKVNGDGYVTWEEARDAEEANMDYEVIEWDGVFDESIIINDSQYVSLQRSGNDNNVDRAAILYRAVGSTDAIVFDTNIPLNNFEMKLNNGGSFLNPNNKTLIANNRFSVEIKTVNNINFFEFTALQNYAGNASDNPSALTVRAGRIEFNITILQRDADPTDWTDGGGYEFELD